MSEEAPLNFVSASASAYYLLFSEEDQLAHITGIIYYSGTTVKSELIDLDLSLAIIYNFFHYP